MILKDHSYEAYLKQNLTKEEIKDPHKVIIGFFTLYDVDEFRKFLWMLMAATITGSFDSKDLTRRERYCMLKYYDQIKKLIEANHILYQKEKK